jgi:poly(beta-D-mannuronate) lyase
MSRSRGRPAIAALISLATLAGAFFARDLWQRGFGSVCEANEDTVAPSTWGTDPFHADQRRERVGRPLPDPPPLGPAPPVRDVIGVSYYTDANHSIANPALKRKNQESMRPLHDYLARVVALADGWAASRPAKPAYAIRAVDLLAGWARGGALLGTVNQQGAYERVWALSGLSLAYLRVRNAPGLDRTEREAVETWFGKVARAVRDGFKDEGPISRLNNHACWAAVAVAAGAIAAHQRYLFSWSVSTAETALGQVRADGFLPLELQRKALALHYHLFAVAPLVMLDELIHVNHEPINDESDLELGWLIERVTSGLHDPAAFAAAAGAPQSITLPPRGADLAWAEIVYAHSHDPRLGALIAAARPLRDDRLGGDLTLAFGVPDLK